MVFMVITPEAIRTTRPIAWSGRSWTGRFNASASFLPVLQITGRVFRADCTKGSPMLRRRATSLLVCRAAREIEGDSRTGPSFRRPTVCSASLQPPLRLATLGTFAARPPQRMIEPAAQHRHRPGRALLPCRYPPSALPLVITLTELTSGLGFHFPFPRVEGKQQSSP